MNKVTLVIIVSTVICACSKDGNTDRKTIVGTWIFMAHNTRSFSFPSVYTASNIYPVATGEQYSTDESIKVSFEDNGSYSFWNGSLPIDKGAYTIVNDSLLVIKPDTAGLIKFSYTLPSAYSSTGLNNPPPSIYEDFVFTSDTLSFGISANSVIVLRLGSGWISKSKSPLLPSGDTLLLNESEAYYKKK